MTGSCLFRTRSAATSLGYVVVDINFGVEMVSPPVDAQIFRATSELFNALPRRLILVQLRNDCALLYKVPQMKTVLLSLSALLISLAGSAVQASAVNFESGSSKINNPPTVHS